MWEPSINSKNSTGKDSLCACGKQCNYIDGCGERVYVETLLFLRGIFFPSKGPAAAPKKRGTAMTFVRSSYYYVPSFYDENHVTICSCLRVSQSSVLFYNATFLAPPCVRQESGRQSWPYGRRSTTCMFIYPKHCPIIKLSYLSDFCMCKK
jgi:hypothetical protein